MNTQKKHMAAPVLSVGLANLWVGLIGGLVFFASACAHAQVCEAEIEQAARSNARLAEVINKIRPGKLQNWSVEELRARYRERLVLADDSLDITAADRCSQNQRAVKHKEDELTVAIKAYEEPKPATTSEMKVADLERRLNDSKLNLCIARVTLAQCNSSIFVRSTGNGGINRPTPQDPVATRTDASPQRQTANASRSTAAKGMGSSSTPGNLSPQQVAACSEEIKRKQIESQNWGGDANDVAARLGQFQKNLFEGKCSGHPEAPAYIAGANKMLGYGGSASGSNVAGNTPSEPVTGTVMRDNSDGSAQGSQSDSSSGRRKNWVGVQNQCIRFVPEKPKDDFQNYSYTNGCPVALKVCDNMKGKRWGCGYEIKPGKTAKNWDRTGNVSRYGGNFVACVTTENGKNVHFDEQAHLCFYYN